MNYTTRIAEAAMVLLDLERDLVEVLDFEYAEGPPAGGSDDEIEGCRAETEEYGTALCALAYLWTEVGYTGEDAFKLARWAIGCAAEHVDILTGEVHEAMLHHAIDAQIAAVSRAQLH